EKGDAMKNTPWYGSVIISVIIFALAFFFYFSPQNTKLQALRADRIKVENEVKDLKQKKKELDKIEAELVVMAAQLKGLEAIIPQRREQADILRQIQQLAYDARLDVTNFTQQKEVNREFYAEWPIVVQVTGIYHNLGTYFDRLSQYSRLFTIEKFAIKALSRQTDQSTITANWTAQTYLFLEEPAGAAPAPKPKPKRPGR
ncbi:MAG TPA: type 4a pilus biogenesis protein PilO, partial [Burkholderiales bacterium]|nr:type 4a pilus biogenesis protein PilO [Burkholderiales bacterium]